LTTRRCKSGSHCQEGILIQPIQVSLAYGFKLLLSPSIKVTFHFLFLEVDEHAAAQALT
jgi:hypothetical protein